MKAALIAGVALALSAAPAAAQSQAAMTAASVRAGRIADQALNAQYGAAMTRLSQRPRLMLRDAQRAWLAFRDGQCRFEASAVEGGSAYPMVLAECTKRLTEERTRQLRFAARCQEGDLACPR